jgi:hypothetical protein
MLASTADDDEPAVGEEYYYESESSSSSKADSGEQTPCKYNNIKARHKRAQGD